MCITKRLLYINPTSATVIRLPLKGAPAYNKIIFRLPTNSNKLFSPLLFAIHGWIERCRGLSCSDDNHDEPVSWVICACLEEALINLHFITYVAFRSFQSLPPSFNRDFPKLESNMRGLQGSTCMRRTNTAALPRTRRSMLHVRAVASVPPPQQQALPVETCSVESPDIATMFREVSDELRARNARMIKLQQTGVSAPSHAAAWCC